MAFRQRTSARTARTGRPEGAPQSRVLACRALRSLAVGLALALAAQPSHAAEAGESKASTASELVPPPEPDRRLALGAAFVPGVAVHGSGHYVLGQRRTASWLFLTEAVGAGLVVGGVTTLFASGNSRNLAAFGEGAIVLGAALVVGSFGADVYGVAATDQPAVQARSRATPWYESELGYRYVADPHFAYAHFLVERVTLRGGHLRFEPSAWFDAGQHNVRYRLEGAYRFIGPLPHETAKYEEHLELVLGAMHQRYLPEQFRRSGGEVALAARFDFGRFGDTLRGSFMELGAGYAVAQIRYDLDGINVPSLRDDVLLATVGLGVTLRGEARPGSEVRVYYDHRHDDYAGGFLLPGRISGVFGKFGADFRWFFGGHAGVRVQVEGSSAVVAGASLLFRDTLPSAMVSPP